MSTKQMVPLRAGGRAKPIMPETFEDVQRIAAMVVKSELFKKAKKDEADDTTIARCCLAIMTGLDVGLSPAQAVQSIAVINGRCLIYGDAVPGLLWAHGFDIDQVEASASNNWTASCTITRPNGKKITRTFSKEQAKKAGLWDERPTVKKKWNDKWEDKPNDSPWFRYDFRMLGWRALGFAKSDGASDVIRGLDIAENHMENEVIDVTPSASNVLEVPDLPDEPDTITAAEASQEAQPELLADAQGYLANLEENLVIAADEETLAEVWGSHLELVDRLSPGDAERAERLHQKHAKRVAKRKGG